MKRFIINLTIIIIVLAALIRVSLEFEGPQETAMRQMVRLRMDQAAAEPANPDSLRVFVCGSASPLGTGQAQACIAVMTPGHFYLVDLGAGAMNNVTSANLPMSRLQGVFLTHFHSDHIAELYEANLNSWVQGRPEPLRIYGPQGVRSVVNGINHTYEHDREYRVTHHGAELLPPDLGEMQGVTIKPGVVLEDGDLTVTAYVADHSPVKPAVGYRFDYRDRSVVISGDSLVTDRTRKITAGADLLLHDARSEMAVTTMATAAEKAGRHRLAKILHDIQDYHASTESLVALGSEVDIGMVAYYHLVPVPPNLVMRKIFEQGIPDNFVVAHDGMQFELPSGTREIIVSD